MKGRLTPEERDRLDALFEEAAELEPAAHAEFLERECGANQRLRFELARLLDGLVGDDHLGGRIAAQLAPGARLGPYRVLEKIAEGGMGEVYVAEQTEPIERRVALKVIKPGMDSAQVLARFEAERQALARMSHPCIAQVFDGGATDAGRPYFAMEYVPGAPITTYCDRKKLSTRERIELFIGVCEGVQHAHQKGVVHRDLKPSNLLVTEHADRPLPKVIDFGVARATVGRLSDRTLHTQAGQIVGTLAYMSPEQADPSGLDVDTRSDIYSLGVVLYQLVSGLLPFDPARDPSAPMSELQRAICEEDPPTPSSHFRRQTESGASIAVRHGTDERALARQLHGDLDWVCMKALEKEPARRYASASELVADLQRHLDDLPVLARRASALYRARKFARRHRVGVAATALVSLGVVAGLAGIRAGQREARASERLARAAIDAERVVGLEVEAGELWPALPEKVGDLEYWQARASDLVAQLPRYRAMLAELRGRAIDDGSGAPRFEVEALQRAYGAIEAAIEGGERLERGLLAEDATIPGQGWSVPKRLAFARRLQAGFAPGGEFLDAWRAHPELDLAPQMGLVPLGRDEESNLWEFAHLASGTVPERDADRALVLDEESAVVFVLIPGGSFEMGPAPGQNSEPKRLVRMSPFFLSKYEMTQGQWLRLTGSNPSAYGSGDGQEWRTAWRDAGDEGSLLHPVEQVSWYDCEKWLRHAGLDLPTEARWEYGARAGTGSAFSTGSDEAVSLQGVANVRDSHFMREGFEDWGRYAKAIDDGATVHWPVDGGQPNAFGLYGVHGNVWEWCVDAYRPLAEVPVSTEPVRDPVVLESSDLRYVYRGGSFRHLPIEARSGARFFDPPTFFGSARGVRPARAVQH